MACSKQNEYGEQDELGSCFLFDLHETRQAQSPMHLVLQAELKFVCEPSAITSRQLIHSSFQTVQMSSTGVLSSSFSLLP
jgi:hypothetical protein